jgi:hypothetical protein
LDSKPTKSVGHFEENKLSDGCRLSFLDSCPKLICTYNFGQNEGNKRWMKTKMNEDVRFGWLFSVAKTFLSATVFILYSDIGGLIPFWRGLHTFHRL